MQDGPRVKRSLPLLDSAGHRLAIGGSFDATPRYEAWDGYDAAMARRKAMERKAERARAPRIVQLTLFDAAA